MSVNFVATSVNFVATSVNFVAVNFCIIAIARHTGFKKSLNSLNS